MNQLIIIDFVKLLKTVKVDLVDIEKGDVILDINSRINFSKHGFPWLISKIVKKKYMIILYDQLDFSIEIPINISRPEVIEVEIVPRTFLK